MIRLLAMTESDRICSVALLESDRRYFEMGAETEPLSHGLLAWMPGLTRLAASCVIHRVESMPSNLAAWLDEIEVKVADRDVPLVRIYLEHCPDGLRQAFRERGYQQRNEIGFLAPSGDSHVPQGLALSEVLSDADWQFKQAIHNEAMHGPDGYTNQADLWVELEQRKCATGQMRSFLVQRDGEVCGTVGAIAHDGLLRLKNIVITPRFRRLGLGVAAVQLMRRLASQQQNRRLGVYGVDGGPGSRLYKRAGLREINCQQEWSRMIGE